MRFIIHVSGVIANNGKVLLVQENKPENRNQWNLPGGHLEHGEPLIDGVLREIHEETGLAATIEGLVGVYTRLAAEDRDHCIRFAFAATTAQTDASPVLTDEIQQCQWFTPEQIQAMPDDQFARKDHLVEIVTHHATQPLLPLDSMHNYR